MSQTKLALTEQDDTGLRNLKEGDSLYTCEYVVTPELGGVVKIRNYIFKAYGHTKNHTDVEINEDDDAIYATIFDTEFPSVDIPNQDLSVGYYYTPLNAVQSMHDELEKVVADLATSIEDLTSKEEAHTPPSNSASVDVGQEHPESPASLSQHPETDVVQ
jgi:hypothetical protein